MTIKEQDVYATVSHDDGTRDKRYTFSKEFTGAIDSKQRFVARFCGEFIADSLDLSGAVLKAHNHRHTRQQTIEAM